MVASLETGQIFYLPLLSIIKQALLHSRSSLLHCNSENSRGQRLLRQLSYAIKTQLKAPCLFLCLYGLKELR